MTTLVVPGIRVETRFDVLLLLPEAAGVLGVVGIADRAPAGGALVGVSDTSEVRPTRRRSTSAPGRQWEPAASLQTPAHSAIPWAPCSTLSAR